jgi:hypothetical protein
MVVLLGRLVRQWSIGRHRGPLDVLRRRQGTTGRQNAGRAGGVEAADRPWENATARPRSAHAASAPRAKPRRCTAGCQTANDTNAGNGNNDVNDWKYLNDMKYTKGNNDQKRRRGGKDDDGNNK